MDPKECMLDVARDKKSGVLLLNVSFFFIFFLDSFSFYLSL